MQKKLRFLKLLQTKIFLYIVLCCGFSTLTAQNYINFLPSAIILQNGENRYDTLIATCEKLNSQYCTFGLRNNAIAYDFSYSTHNGSSKLTFLAATPPNPNNFQNSIFYLRSLNVGNGGEG